MQSPEADMHPGSTSQTLETGTTSSHLRIRKHPGRISADGKHTVSGKGVLHRAATWEWWYYTRCYVSESHSRWWRDGGIRQRGGTAVF